MTARVRSLTHLEALESEAIHVMREVAAELERPVLLFSGGKDSIVLLRLAEKAFRPARFPFPLMHVDTGHNFDEVIEYRDRRVAELGERLIVASVQETIDTGRVVEETGPRASRNRLQTTTLLDAIEEHGFDAAFGGARRDEERARAKERILSFRDDFGTWDPRRQRPELWNLYNGRIRRGEHVRVFPLSNWTELDVWQYIAEERLEVPNIYFAHDREVFARDGMLYATSDHVELIDGEQPFTTSVRYRTVGDMSCTGAVQSRAADLEAVVREIAATRVTERGETRAALVGRMQKAMQTAVANAWKMRKPGIAVANPAQAIVLASIIEKETGALADRGRVGGVFVNRLRLGMLLQTDPTVIYGLGERFDGNLRKRDLLTDSPFNTYTRGGLPPTPISMPGKASLQVAVRPDFTAALYFVARGDGTSEFSVTLAEHNRAVDKYQRGKKPADRSP